MVNTANGMLAPMLRHIAYLASMAVLVLYIANPTGGLFELIPDNLPVVGNLDEAAATALLISLFRRWRHPDAVPHTPRA
jgi:uncharacterized membrane protein YkvA (DUF1232 family)